MNLHPEQGFRHSSTHHAELCFCRERATVHISYGSGCGTVCGIHAEAIKKVKPHATIITLAVKGLHNMDEVTAIAEAKAIIRSEKYGLYVREVLKQLLETIEKTSASECEHYAQLAEKFAEGTSSKVERATLRYFAKALREGTV